MRIRTEPMSAAPRADALTWILKPNPVVLAAIWLFVVAHFAGRWVTLGDAFNDTDDAMRLVEVRDFLAGQGWFDLHQYRLDPPADRPMHWSRFVDLPIALIIRLADLFVSIDTAEKVALHLWPTLVLIPVLVAARRIACRIGGDWSALPALYLTATCAPVIGQFVPGRIDHHNVQIALTLWLIVAALEPASRRRGVALAMISAVMMAVGMETLPFVGFAAALVAHRWITADDGDEAVAYGLALAGATLAMMVATLPPAEWLRGACDALSANYVALAVVGGLGLAAGARVSPDGRGVRIAYVAAIGAAALFAFALPQPMCLRGPFGEILPEVRTVWLDEVTEVKPWHVFFSAHRVDGLVALMMPILGSAAAFRLAREPEVRAAPAFWFLVAALLLTTAIGLAQIRTMIYADMFALVLVAAVIGLLAGRSEAAGRSATVVVLAGTVLASSSLATFALGRIAPASWKTDDAVHSAASTAGEGAAAPADADCTKLSNWSAVARLPPGLVAAEINLGPTILAATAHSVVTAPYHRMQRGILDADRMMRSEPDAALAAIDARGVDLVAICTVSRAAAVDRASHPDSLIARLMDGRIPARLEEVVGDGPIRAFRIRPATAIAEMRGSLTFR